MNFASRVWFSCDALLYRSEQGQWLSFINGDNRGCKIQLFQNDVGRGHVFHFQQSGQTIYQYDVTASMTVKRTDADFLQVVNNTGRDRVVLGLKFRNEMDTGNCMAALEQCTTSGYTSVPNTTPHHGYRQPEFATVPGGYYQGAPNMRGDGGYYPREQFERGQDQRQGHYPEQRQYHGNYNGMQHQQQQPVGGGACMPDQPTTQGRVQEVSKFDVPDHQPKPVIKSKQELECYTDLLAVALTENDTDFAKLVVKLLVEAKGKQRNFGVKFLPDGAKTYFKLCVKIEREMFPLDYPITYYLYVTEYFTIKHLEKMVELKFSIKSDQQHWIIGKDFNNDKNATLKSFGIKSKGAEVHLFISKGGVVEEIPSGDNAIVKDGGQQPSQYQQNQYQQPVQQFQNEQYNQLHQDQQYYQPHQDQRYNQPYQDQHYNQPHQDQRYNQPHQDQHYNQPRQDQRYNQPHQNQRGYHDQQQGRHNQQLSPDQGYPYQQPQNQQYQQQIAAPHSNNYQVPNSYGQFGNETLPAPQPMHHHYYDNPATHMAPYNDARSQPFRSNSDQMVNIIPEAKPQKPVRPPTPPKIGWTCPECTVINGPFRPGCEVCSAERPKDYKPPADYKPSKDEEKWMKDEAKEKEKLEEFEREQKLLQQNEARKNFQTLLDAANQNLIPNDEKFECPICILEFEAGEGVKLRECFHCCCKECLHDHILRCQDADVKCPCNVNDELACKGSITEAEMRSLLTGEELAKVHNRGLVFAEGQAKSYHCKTPDCAGFCFYEDEVNNFDCPVCTKRNCLLCKAIHYPEMNCKEYQEDLRIKAANDEAAQATQKMLEDMIKNGEAMYCPNDNCRLIIQKKDGCDWIQCSCATEICWVTKGPRWGPKGKGDTSGGCKCDIWGPTGRRCHPDCGCCH